MRSADDSLMSFDFVGAQYAHAVGASIAQGRDFVDADDYQPAQRALVNASFAEFYWPGQLAVGKYFHFRDSIAIRVVGVVADTRDHSLTTAASRRVYFPYLHTDTTAIGHSQNLRLLVRTSGDPTLLVQSLRRAVLSVDPTLPIDAIDPIPKLIADSISQQRLLAELATGFGVLAVMLAAVGLYGVMTYAIVRRTGEIGLRMALGAQSADVLRLVLVESLRLVGIGVLIGLPLALVGTRLLRAQLHGVPATDPVSLAVAVTVLGLSGLVAVLVPASRASKLSPMRALRGA